MLALELTQQPELGQAPVTLDRVGRHVKSLGRLLDAQSAEESQLDHPGFPRVDGGELFERAIQSDKVQRALRRERQPVAQRNSLNAAAALLIPARSRVVDQDPAHQ